MYSGRDTPKGWVSPFGHPRINDRSHLPAAFRSVPRPSSPLGAKASTECPSLTPYPHHRPRTGPKHAPRCSQSRSAAPAHPQGAVKSAPGRCASLTHTTTDHLHHVKEHARPARHPAPSRGSRTTPHGRVSEVSPHPPRDAAHQAIDRQTPKAESASLTRHRATTQSAVGHFSTLPGDFLSSLQLEMKWRRSDSNRRPPACKAGALPLSYAPAGEDRQQLRRRTATGYRSRETALRRSASQVTSLSLRGTTFLHNKNVVGQGGLEPPTPRLSSVCSNQLSYWPRTGGVAQSREGCAVGAHRSPKAATRHAGMAGMSQTTRNLGERWPSPPIPSGTDRSQARARHDSHERRHPRAPKDPSGRHP